VSNAFFGSYKLVLTLLPMMGSKAFLQNGGLVVITFYFCPLHCHLQLPFMWISSPRSFQA